MSLVIYNVLLTALIVIAFPFALIALIARPRYRVGLRQRLGVLPADIIQRAQQTPPFWLHAPSVGEFLATRPFLQGLKKHFPHHTTADFCTNDDGLPSCNQTMP